MKYIMLFLIFLCGCSHLKTENKVIYRRCGLNINTEGYRLFFGSQNYEWIDICSIRDKEFNVVYEDKTPIEIVECQENDILVYKQNSVWIVNNINDESNLTLSLVFRKK